MSNIRRGIPLRLSRKEVKEVEGGDVSCPCAPCQGWFRAPCVSLSAWRLRSNAQAFQRVVYEY